MTSPEDPQPTETDEWVARPEARPDEPPGTTDSEAGRDGVPVSPETVGTGAAHDADFPDPEASAPDPDASLVTPPPGPPLSAGDWPPRAPWERNSGWPSPSAPARPDAADSPPEPAPTSSGVPPPPPVPPPATSWGTFGETPTSPPTSPPTPAAAPGPAAAPTVPDGSTGEGVPDGGRPETAPGGDRPVTPGWLWPVVAAAALALFVGGLLAGWAIADRDGGDTATTPGPQTPVTFPAGDGGEGAIVPDDVPEPVAAVAAAVAPSVVQIDTNFGLGSGIVMDTDGHILTAAHVIEGAIELRVRLADGTMVPAEIVGTHPESDVGVVKIDSRDDLQPAALGVDAEVQVGQLAVAVGSPFGLEQTVTSGIVSALDRPVQTEATFLVGMIQTDASINPGNSGGALADRHGRVIGVNDAIRTQGGGNEGVGFAIPIDLAVTVAERLIAGESIQSGFLGVSVGPVMEGRPGALVQEVTAGTPADEAGIEVEDLIIAVESQPVRGVQELRARILAIDPGTPVTVTVVRGGEEVDLEVTLTVSAPPPGS